MLSAGLGNGVGKQHGHLVELRDSRLQVHHRPLQTRSGTAAEGGRCALVLAGRLAGELGDAEEELLAAQLDAAAVVEQGRALPACPTAPDQAGAAGPAAAGAAPGVEGPAAHHAPLRRILLHAHRLLPLSPPPLLLTAACTETRVNNKPFNVLCTNLLCFLQRCRQRSELAETLKYRPE